MRLRQNIIMSKRINRFHSNLCFSFLQIINSQFGALIITLMIAMFGTALPTLIVFPEERPVVSYFEKSCTSPELYALTLLVGASM